MEGTKLVIKPEGEVVEGVITKPMDLRFPPVTKLELTNRSKTAVAGETLVENEDN
jgi:hypothetical protein